MSVRVMQAVWEHSKQSGGALVLLLAIADNAHDDGDGAYPSNETLAKKARMTGRNVNMLLKTLEAAGEIAISHGAGPHGCNVYRVLLPGLATPENISPLKTFHPEKSDTQGVKNPVKGGEKNSTKGVKPASPKPSFNHQENHQVKPSEEERAPRVTLATYQPDPSLREWAESRVPGIDFADVVENWRDWHTSKKSKIADYNASLRTWIRREQPTPIRVAGRGASGAPLSNEQAKRERTIAALRGVGGNHAPVNVPDEPLEARFSVLRRDHP